MARVQLVEGNPAPIGAEISSEAELRAKLREQFAQAGKEGLSELDLSPPTVSGISLQQIAEIMFAEAAELGEDHPLKELRFVVSGEPNYRLFEMVGDAERIRIQLEKLKRGRP